MDFEKEDKGFVIWWIDRQFAQVPAFPCSCCVVTDGKTSVCRDHVLAYRAWSKVPTKRKRILEWINTWLGEEEQKQLLDAIKKNNHYKARTHETDS